MFANTNRIGTIAFLFISYLLSFHLALAGEPTVLFHDDFDGPLSSEWRIYDGSAWTSDGWVYVHGGAGPHGRDGIILTTTDNSWDNYKLSVRFIAEGGGDDWYGANIFFNVKEPSDKFYPAKTFYVLHILTPAWSRGESYESNSFNLWKLKDGEFVLQCGWYPRGAPAGLVNDFDNKIDITVQGGEIKVWANGKFAFTCTDPDPIVGGIIGLAQPFEATTRFEYVYADSLTATNNFATFTPRAELKVGPNANDDSFKLTGYIKLAETSNGVNLPDEPVTVKLGSFSATIPAGSFQQGGDGSLHFKGTIDKAKLDVTFWPLKAKSHGQDPVEPRWHQQEGSYWFRVLVSCSNLAATTMQPQAQITVGDDQGQATLDVGYAKLGKGKDAQNWVFPEAKTAKLRSEKSFK